MSGVRVNEVYKNYKNVKDFLPSDIDVLVALKPVFETRFRISRRRLDCINNINILISVLEKHGDLDAFNIHPIEVMCAALSDGPFKKELKTSIGIHKKLIDQCDNAVIPVYKYAEEILDERENSWNSAIGNNRERSELDDRPSGVQTGRASECDNHRPDEIFEQCSEVVELISEEIGRKWLCFARSLGLKNAEIDDIDSHHNSRLNDKCRKSLRIALANKSANSARTAILGALSKAGRNDLKKNVESMFDVKMFGRTS